jgi:hypothetical protein
MARMLGRYQVPGCCPGTRAGLPGVDCDGGHPIGARAAKRLEGRDTAREITRELYPADREWLAAFIPLYDLSDCVHGCNGSPCTADLCTFTCHLAPQE